MSETYLGKLHFTDPLYDILFSNICPDVKDPQFFSVRILSSRIGFKKPDVRLFNLAMERLGVTSGYSVYIGDNPAKDLIGAKKAGMISILFRSECHEYNGFQPDRCFYDYAELENILREIMHTNH